MSSPGPKQRVFAGLAEIAQALGHANRLELLEHLGQGERSVEDLAERGSDRGEYVAAFAASSPRHARGGKARCETGVLSAVGRRSGDWPTARSLPDRGAEQR